jgi:hypothetical protein
MGARRLRQPIELSAVCSIVFCAFPARLLREDSAEGKNILLPPFSIYPVRNAASHPTTALKQNL